MGSLTCTCLLVIQQGIAVGISDYSGELDVYATTSAHHKRGHDASYSTITSPWHCSVGRRSEGQIPTCNSDCHLRDLVPSLREVPLLLCSWCFTGLFAKLFARLRYYTSQLIMMQMSQFCNPRIFVSGCLYSLSTPPLALNLWSDLERSESLLARDESMEGTTEEIRPG